MPVTDPRVHLLQQELEGWAPEPDLQQEETRFLFTELCRTATSPFDRGNLPGHITASAFVIDTDQKRILLVHHGKLDRWLQPGGHVEAGDPNTLEAAMREVREETGLEDLVPLQVGIFDLDLHEIPPHGTTAAHWHYDVRHVFQSTCRNTSHQQVEINEVGWFTVNEAHSLGLDASIVRMIRMAQGRGWLQDEPITHGRCDVPSSIVRK